MINRHRQQQPLERAVAKALARKAELRAARTDDAPPVALTEPMSTSLAPGSATAEQAVWTDVPTSEIAPESASATGHSPEESPGPRLPAAAMGLIERLANRSLDEPVDADLEAELGDIQLEPLPAAPADARGASSGASSAPDTEPSPTERRTIEPRISPPGNVIALTEEESATPSRQTAPEATAKAASSDAGPIISKPGHLASSGSAVDAFQLLLANNPEADDASRTDLRDAPSMRNPRKALASPPPEGETGAETTVDPAASDTPKDSARDPAARSADPAPAETERSFRNWFSPKQDPNPPPVPDRDPTLD